MLINSTMDIAPAINPFLTDTLINGNCRNFSMEKDYVRLIIDEFLGIFHIVDPLLSVVENSSDFAYNFFIPPG